MLNRHRGCIQLMILQRIIAEVYTCKEYYQGAIITRKGRCIQRDIVSCHMKI
jgi:hypothetical protein